MPNDPKSGSHPSHVKAARALKAGKFKSAKSAGKAFGVGHAGVRAALKNLGAKKAKKAAPKPKPITARKKKKK